MQFENLQDASALTHIKVERKPVYKEVQLALVDRDILRNPRDEMTAFRATDPDMVDTLDSIRIKGYLPGHPVIVIEYHVDGILRYLTLRGNRRVWCCKHLGFETIPAVVYAEGTLTDEQQLVIILDHDQEAAIGPIGELKAVEACQRLGLSYKATAQMLRWMTMKGKPNTSRVQGYAELLKLPKVEIDGILVDIKEEWIKQQRDKNDKSLILRPLTLATDIRHLYESREKDIAAEDRRIEETNLDQPNKYMLQAGPELVKELISLKTTGETTKARQQKAGLSPTALIGIGELADNHPIFASFMLGLGGRAGYKHAPLIKVINDSLRLTNPVVAEDAAKTVEDIFGEQPVVEQPVVEQPVVEQPVVEQPVRSGKRHR